MQKTKIEWTEITWNPVTGCTKVSEGCDNCYARRISKRLTGRFGYPVGNPFKVTLHPDRLLDPLELKKPHKIFVCSMGELFHEKVPFSFIDKVFGSMFAAPQHLYLILTKRPKQMKLYIDHLDEMCFETGDPVCWSDEPNNNIWLGVSVENDKYIQRIIELLKIPAAVYFVSHEPALGPIDYPKEFLALGNRAWLIAGGESGPKARPMHPDWAKHDRDQCKAAGIPFFFKQWGEWKPDGPAIGNFCDRKTIYLDQRGNILRGLVENAASMESMIRLGKKKTGCLLDGQLWNQSPKMRF